MGTAQDASPEGTERSLNKVMLFVIVTVFILFMIFTFLIFRPDSSMSWKREIARVESIHASGNYEEAAAALTVFGARYPDAASTYNWNRQMGQYHGDAGDWETAARFYGRAVEIDDAAGGTPQPGVRALAGEAAWKAGDRKAAIPFLAAEIKDVHVAVGDHDRANVYLGMSLTEEGRYVEAFQHFQAIQNREAWRTEIDDFYATAQAKFIEPAREKARTLSLADIP